MLSMSVSIIYLPVFSAPWVGDVDRTAVLDNGTFRDSVFYNLLGEEFINLAVSLDTPLSIPAITDEDSSNTHTKPPRT
jgi:hypothetical protein